MPCRRRAVSHLKGREEASAAIRSSNPLDKGRARRSVAVVEDHAIYRGRPTTTMLTLSGFKRPAAVRAFIFNMDIIVTAPPTLGPTR
jgi:hypothetical protein